MNKKLSILITILTSFMIFPAFSNAPNSEDLVGNYYLGLESMYIDTDAGRHMTSSPLSSLDHGYGLGIQLGHRATKKWEFRLLWNSLNIEVQNNAKKPDAGLLGLDALYFPDEKSFYFLGGLTKVDLEIDEPSINFGAGYRYYFKKNLAAHLEGKTFYNLDNKFNDYSIGLGLIYFFDQASSPSPRLKAKDSDMDGVPDAKDSCPNSPRGAEVNVYGCSDSDGDGVADNFDLCPATPMGEAVNNKGCPDSDNDGVADNVDKCLTTPMGDNVDHKGCSLAIAKAITIELLVHFDTNKAIVKSSYLPEIERVASFMKKYPETKVALAGHTSVLGSSDYNQNLSERRAKAVAKILIEKFNIGEHRVTAAGYGESQLKNTANTKAAHTENRRMEAVISTTR